VHPAEGLLTARGKLLHRTPTLAFCEAHVVDEKGQLCAHGTGTFKYLRALGKRRVQEVRSETRPAAAAPSNTDTDPKARP